MIDIHSHIIPSVDDGSQALEMSLDMIKKEVKDGVKAVILTPHVQSHVTKASHEERKATFDNLVAEVKKLGIEIELYLGAEILYKSHIHPDYNQMALAGSKYLLVEFSPTIETPIEEVVYDLAHSGFIPIVAHVERYGYLKFEDYFKIKQAGGLLQVNADSAIGFDKKKRDKLILQMLKEELVDFIATDTHNMDYRQPILKEAFNILKHKIDITYLNEIFYTNALKIINK
jgi:protein-tyrosine phosphatase